jgi:acetyltransferase-like isoleucine patch superfamily enzyme
MVRIIKLSLTIINYRRKPTRENEMAPRIHPTADVSDRAEIGEGTIIWHQAQVREGVKIGRDCIIGKGVYVDAGVPIGDNVKIQNYVSVYHGVKIEDGVFVGPHVCFTNDLRPRAINPDDSLKAADDWILSETLVGHGAALGANSTIRCGITIGEWAMVGSGSVVTNNVPAWLVYGIRRIFMVLFASAGDAPRTKAGQQFGLAKCGKCARSVEIAISEWERIT